MKRYDIVGYYYTTLEENPDGEFIKVVDLPVEALETAINAIAF